MSRRVVMPLTMFAAFVTLTGCEASSSSGVEVVIEALVPAEVETACFEVTGVGEGAEFSREVCGQASEPVALREACHGERLDLEVVTRRLTIAGEDATARFQSPCTDDAPCTMTYFCDGREAADFKVLFVPKLAHGLVSVGLDLDLPTAASEVCLDMRLEADGSAKIETVCAKAAGALTWVGRCLASASPGELEVAISSVRDASGAELARDVLGCGDGERCATTFDCIEDGRTALSF
jgi:hypothetical protein